MKEKLESIKETEKMNGVPERTPEGPTEFIRKQKKKRRGRQKVKRNTVVIHCVELFST
jgi:hypothetical protein